MKNIPPINGSGNSADFEITTETSFDFLKAIRLEISQISKSKQSIKNILATFNQLLKRGFINESNLKDSFDRDFEHLRQEVKIHVQKIGKNRQWPSHINDIRSAVDRVYAFDISQMPFKEALVQLCKRKWGYNVKRDRLFAQLTKEAGVSSSVLYCWFIKGTSPTVRKSVEYVSVLDEFFQAKGELLRKVNVACSAIPPTEPCKRSTHFPLPNNLKEQLNDYIKFRVDGVIPNRDIRFGNEMDKRQLRGLRNLKGIGKWTRDGSGECRTAQGFLKQVQSYGNVIALESRNLGQNVDWDIKLLMDHEWLYRFKENCKTRGIFTTPSAFFEYISHECAPNSYFSTYHAFTKDRDSWLGEIKLLKEECWSYSAELSKFRKNGKGKENISFLLSSENLEESIVAIATELDRREMYFSGYPKVSAASVAACFRMLMELPLRVKNLCQLRYIENFDPGDQNFINWPSIVWDKKRKAYRVHVPRQFLKNRNSQGITDIDYCYSDFTTPGIKKYLSLRREFFGKYSICSSYFFFNIRPSTKGFGGKLRENNLGKNFSTTTYKALVTLWGNFVKEHNIRGINLHAMRHLSATLFLKHHPENYTALATLLMDDLNTVISTYAKRDDKGNFEKIRHFCERIWSKQAKRCQDE